VGQLDECGSDARQVHGQDPGAIRSKLSHPLDIVSLGSSPAARRPPTHPPIPEVAVSSRVIPFPVLPVGDKRCTVSSPLPLHDAVASCRHRHRRLIAATGQWALARGVSLPPDHVALWAAAADELGYGGPVEGMTGPWRASALPDLMANALDWCALAGCSVPSDLAASLWHLYGFLADTGLIHPASDPLPELRAAILVFGTCDRFRRSPPPEPTAA
jgi:hypothetical protein